MPLRCSFPSTASGRGSNRKPSLQKGSELLTSPKRAGPCYVQSARHMTPAQLGGEIMIEKLARYHDLVPTLLCISLFAWGCSAASTDKSSPAASPQVSHVQETTLTAEALSSILSILLSKDTPLVNLRHIPAAEIQVALPPVRGELAERIGNVTLLPVKSKPGLVLEIALVSASPDEVWLRADVAFFEPERGFAPDGAEWRELVFRREASGWRLFKSLDGVIK